MSINKLLLAVLFFTSLPVLAVLPPRYHNANDLDAMISYIKSNTKIIETLRSIDFQLRAIHYGNNCTVTFRRADVARVMPGPAAPLVVDKTECADSTTSKYLQ